MLVIQEHVNLKPYHTFGTSETARYFVDIKSEDDLMDLIHSSLYKENEIFFLGSGSNVLFTKPFDGVVIKSSMKGIQIVDETQHHVWIEVAAGEVWHNFVMYCINRNWGGVENLALIPGTVGAAPVQNIGAYGVEVKDVIDKVFCINTTTGQSFSFSNSECLFEYRDSIFKSETKKYFFITRVTFKLTKDNHSLKCSYGSIQHQLQSQQIFSPTLQQIADAVITIRQSKLPDVNVLCNAGSFFKNPIIDIDTWQRIKKVDSECPSYKAEDKLIKVPAGRLIEVSGWKGKRIGNIGVHDKQALVIVNYNNGTGKEILNFSKKIQKAVREKFGVKLFPEVKIL